MGDNSAVGKEGSGTVTNIFSIDEYNLEKEWIGQPKLYFTWAKRAADCRSRFDEAKTNLDLVRAEVDQEIRETPAKYGFGEKKPTEKAIESLVVQHERVVRAMHNLVTMRHAYDIAQAAVAALDHRKTALERLVQLHLANYYSEPRSPKGYEDEIEEAKKDRAWKSRQKRAREAHDD